MRNCQRLNKKSTWKKNSKKRKDVEKDYKNRNGKEKEVKGKGGMFEKSHIQLINMEWRYKNAGSA